MPNSVLKGWYSVCMLHCNKYIGCYMITSTILCIAWYHVYWAYLTGFSTQHVIEAPEPSQESELSCICVLGVSMLPFSTVFIFDFGIVPRPLTQIHSQLSDFVQALQLQMTGLNLLYGPKPPLLVQWCGCTSVFQMEVKYQPSHTTGGTALI